MRRFSVSSSVIRVWVITAFAVGFMLAPAHGQSRQEAAALSRALEAVRAENWSVADIESRAAGRLGRDIVEWHRLRSPDGDFDEYRDFLTRRPDWPGLKLLRRRGERSLRDNTPGADVIAYFRDQPPQTGEGALQLARAWRQAGNPGDADAEIVLAWRTLPMGEVAFASYLDAYTQILQPHHAARLDMLLWRGLEREARAMQALVSTDWQALTRARLALRNDRNGVDALVAAVPASLANHPGLSFERFAWRARKGRHQSAAELAIAQSALAEGLGEADRWGNHRRVITRQLMRDGKPRTAYQLAATNGMAAGRHYADLEWLAGYIALRKLNDAKAARRHFARFRAAVFTPISLGRAGYWQGRAEEALGNDVTAREFYEFGARYQTSFYGLLAAERIGSPMDQRMTGQEVFRDWRQADFMNSSVLQAALLMHKAGELTLAERFLTHLSESLSRDEIGQLGDLALSLDEPHLGVMIGKRAAQQGLTLHKAYYPLHPLAGRQLPVVPELALSIARRESEFDPVVVSPAGARGLMQLMPRTAQAVSQDLGERYSLAGLTENPEYNARLGSAYLADLIEEFGPSYVLVAAGYNAGPSRPNRWINVFGDPRESGTDPVDWIEHIPFRETRNYVMRVMESLVIYRARLSGRVSPIRLSEELRRTR